jgi:hypothetical protein
MSTDESVLDLVLLNLSVAASLARNRLLLSVPARALDDNPYGSAASLIRHIQALEDALRHFDRAASPLLDDDFVP